MKPHVESVCTIGLMAASARLGGEAKTARRRSGRIHHRRRHRRFRGRPIGAVVGADWARVG